MDNVKRGDTVRLKNHPGCLPYRVLDPDTTDPIGGAKHVIAARPLGGPPNRTHYLLPSWIEATR